MDNLLTYLIGNGLNTIQLTPFIYSQTDNDVKIDFLNTINRIDLKSTESYSRETSEFKIFDMLQTVSTENKEIDETFNEKIYVDGIALDDKNISDNVFFEFDAADETTVKEKYELKLSKILPDYKDQTEALTKVIENFEPSLKSFLRSKVFKAKTKRHNEIFKEIHDGEEEVLTSYQLFFLLLHKRNNPTVDVFKNKLNISKYFDNNGETEEYKKTVIEFLETLIQFNYTTDNFQLNGCSIDNYIIDEKYGIETEKLPNFILEWLDKSAKNKEEKLHFLNKLGLNNNDSNIVLLRKGLLEQNKEVFEKGKVNLDNETLLINTMQWLKKVQENNEVIFTDHKNLLKDFYEKVAPIFETPVSKQRIYINNKNSYIKYPLANVIQQNTRIQNINKLIFESQDIAKKLKNNLLIPVLNSLDEKKYVFKEARDNIFHTYDLTKWEPYQKETFTFLSEQNVFVIDEVFPKSLYPYIEDESHDAIEKVDSEYLFEHSIPLEELLETFNDWSKSNEISIRIYNESQLPVSLSYNDKEIKHIENKTEFKDGELYYTCFKEKQSILSSLKNILDEADYNALFTFLNDSSTNVNDKKAITDEAQLTDEETAALKKLFGNDIPQAFYKDLNLAACVSALVQLNKDGYDISEAEKNFTESHKYSQLEPVFLSSNSNPLTIMCRSAKTGILQLRASAWDRLEDEDIKLFVKTGRNENQFHIFDDKQSVLDKSQTKYQVFRVEAESLAINTDSILNGDFEKDKIWLILKMKDKEEYKSIFGAIRDVENNPEW